MAVRDEVNKVKIISEGGEVQVNPAFKVLRTSLS